MSKPNSKSIKIQVGEDINYNSIQQSNEMLLYNTFKFYFEIDLENNIGSIKLKRFFTNQK